MSAAEHYDIVVVGSGPAGQKAAIQGVKAGKSVAMIEREQGVGGGCVYRGTIPSKTLRETALRVASCKLGADVAEFKLREDIEVASLMTRLDAVVEAHAKYMSRQLERNGVKYLHGRARFVAPRELAVRAIDGSSRTLRADVVVLATGSRPRTPAEIPVDHENILDSDSILSMIYLPRTLTVLGGGVIASEYASIFSQLGVQVTMVDKTDRPLKFVDAELTQRFVAAFEENGGRYLGGRTIAAVEWDGTASVVTTLAGGEVIRSDKMLVALGRAANVEGLDLAVAGLAPNDRGVIEVDENCRTKVPHIYAVGDVIGPPALAASAMEQGRRAVRDALGLDVGHPAEMFPIGIYTIPEMASVGLGEEEARRRHGDVMIGRARFDEVARGQISNVTEGLLKLVADGYGRKLLGAHIVGEGATELIHVAQMALHCGCDVDTFVENIFNFPTLAEAYRVAALDIAEQRQPH
jgi:NAD(P) transhydrogenase